MVSRLIPMVGLRFGRGVVLQLAPKTARDTRWICECDCGNLYIAYGVRLRNGACISCGCDTSSRQKHGAWRTPTWNAWRSMRARCNSRPGNKTDHLYYGRGIKVCPEWDDFRVFLEDMGEKPEGRSLDRIDNDKGYFKENCRWATPTEQARNQRRFQKFEWDGAHHYAADLCALYAPHLSASAFHFRLRSGWSLEKAITTPIKKRRTA